MSPARRMAVRKKSVKNNVFKYFGFYCMKTNFIVSFRSISWGEAEKRQEDRGIFLSLLSVFPICLVENIQ